MEYTVSKKDHGEKLMITTMAFVIITIAGITSYLLVKSNWNLQFWEIGLLILGLLMQIIFYVKLELINKKETENGLTGEKVIEYFVILFALFLLSLVFVSLGLPSLFQDADLPGINFFGFFLKVYLQTIFICIIPFSLRFFKILP